MFGTKIVTKTLQGSFHNPLTDFEGKENERLRRTLANNPSIAQDDEILDTILTNGKLVAFAKGETLIEEKELSDDVYFLLAGEVDIVVNKQKAAIRHAPNQIGEMAAMKPGKPRSASVVVRSGSLVAWKISGTALVTIIESYPKFENRLNYEVTERFRERLNSSKIAQENNSMKWLLTSGIATLVSLVLTLLAFKMVGWETVTSVIYAVVVSIFIFLFCLLNNPAFFWHRCFKICLWSFFGKTLFDLAFTLEMDEGLSNLNIVLQTSGSDTLIMNALSSLITSIPWVIVLVICAMKIKPYQSSE